MTKKLVSNKYDYDLHNDSLLFYIKGKKYKSSLEIDNIILDFSEDDDFMTIEILDASKKFKVPKRSLLNIKKFDATIEIDKVNIKVAMELAISKRNKLFTNVLEALTKNIFNLPSSKQGIVVTC
jgi:uncharacterized protein YuzE